ncbi:MAG: ATP-binding protein [Gammaproteobacteria bacterium]|nr:ATP-binding protein [Gammaproteobacteria bacterium]
MEDNHAEKGRKVLLPCIFVAIIGLTFSCLIALYLPAPDYPDSLVHLLLGILITLGLVFITYLARLNKQHRIDLTITEKHYQEEIAERLVIEESRQKLEKALLQGQKLQAIGTLAGGIAHDFNNVLYAIMGYVEMAREDVPADSVLHQNLSKVLDAAKRGQELVSRILAFSRRQHHEFKPIHMKETIEGVLALLLPTIPASIIIDYHPATEDSIILGNQTQLHQVIVNIITNAIDAMEGEGTITITVERISHDSAHVKHLTDAHQHTHYCKIKFKDTGHGMDAPTLERIFEPFFTTKEVGRGTGLGLSTVHTIVTEHKGDILVDSQPGHGATFTILLPEYNEQGEKHG